MLLLLATILHLALLLATRISTRRLGIPVLRIIAHGIRRLIMRLAVVFVLWLMSLTVTRASGRLSTTTLQINVHTAFVFLSMVLQVQLLAYLLYSRLYFLDVVRAVVSFAHNHVKVALASFLRVANALFQDLFGLFHELTCSQRDKGSADVVERAGRCS